MKIIKAGFEFIEEKDSIKKIELVARTCYKSEDKITEGSAKKMVGALVRSKHYAMLEHSSAIFQVDQSFYKYLITLKTIYEEHRGKKCFLRFTDEHYSDRWIVSGNLRAWVEFMYYVRDLGACIQHKGMVDICIALRELYIPVFEFLPYVGCILSGEVTMLYPEDLTDREKLVHYDLTVKFIVDRGVSHELVRHRVASFAQESTRYCNYGKADEITVILPFYFDTGMGTTSNSLVYAEWRAACERSERAYMSLLNMGATPQEARAVLPNSLKTEVVMTANIKEWIHFFKLRALGVTGKPHPQMQEVALPLLRACKEKFPKEFYALKER